MYKELLLSKLHAFRDSLKVKKKKIYIYIYYKRLKKTRENFLFSNCNHPMNFKKFDFKMLPQILSYAYPQILSTISVCLLFAEDNEGQVLFLMII